ncbi:MAG: hypothetical protein ACOYJY_04160 [Acutalibacteraceae bacterium]
MIKGINRQMIEVTDTGSPYFERALLVVRPACADRSDEQLRREAHRLLKAAGGYSGIKRMRRRRQLCGAALSAAGGLLGLLVGLAIHGI